MNLKKTFSDEELSQKWAFEKLQYCMDSAKCTKHVVLPLHDCNRSKGNSSSASRYSIIGQISSGYIRLKNTIKEWYDHSEIFGSVPQTIQQDFDKYFLITRVCQLQNLPNLGLPTDLEYLLSSPTFLNGVLWNQE